MPDTELLDRIEEIAQAAGQEILSVYNNSGGIDVTVKEDDSPLTEADRRAHRLIVGRLSQLTPEIPVLSEESVQPDFAHRRLWQRYWLVDPLDGTREFIKRNGEFTVNIALVDANRATLGIVHVPVSGVTYRGMPGLGASRRDGNGNLESISCRRMHSGQSQLTVVASRSHRAPELEALLDRLRGRFADLSLTGMGSSLKFCLLAEGAADLYPRLGPTSEWDTAAAQAVLAAAGGAVVNFEFEELRYNTKADILNPHFLAVGDPASPWQEWLG